MSYHKYVFDSDKRKFKGNFEGMYQNEERDKFDSWGASNLRNLAKRIHLEIINSYNFQTILDFGCGKGAFTHLLKKRNNTVTGLDISKTAIKKAQATYGSEIHFDTIKNNDFSEGRFSKGRGASKGRGTSNKDSGESNLAMRFINPGYLMRKNISWD